MKCIEDVTLIQNGKEGFASNELSSFIFFNVFQHTCHSVSVKCVVFLCLPLLWIMNDTETCLFVALGLKLGYGSLLAYPFNLICNLYLIYVPPLVLYLSSTHPLFSGESSGGIPTWDPLRVQKSHLPPPYCPVTGCSCLYLTNQKVMGLQCLRNTKTWDAS